MNKIEIDADFLFIKASKLFLYETINLETYDSSKACLGMADIFKV